MSPKRTVVAKSSTTAHPPAISPKYTFPPFPPAPPHSLNIYANPVHQIIAQGAGNRETLLCADPGAFQDAITACEDCAADAVWTGDVRSYNTLQEYLNFCEDR